MRIENVPLQLLAQRLLNHIELKLLDLVILLCLRKLRVLINIHLHLDC